MKQLLTIAMLIFCGLFLTQILECSAQQQTIATKIKLVKYDQGLKYLSSDLGFTWILKEAKLIRYNNSRKQISYDLGTTWSYVDKENLIINCSYLTNTGNLKISGLENNCYEINIIDLFGNVIFFGNIEKGLDEIHLVNLTSNSYFVKVIQNNKILTGNFIINR